MTAPSEEQVRAILERLLGIAGCWERNARLLGNLRAADIVSAMNETLALLDAGRKDKERVDWIEQEIETGDITISGSAHGVTLDLGEGVPKSRERTVRAAIDQARGA